MLGKMQLDDDAPWKQRFRAPMMLWTQIAPANRTRGLVNSNVSGKDQLYAWDVATNTLRQLTDRSTGIIDAALSGDGRFVYYLDDHQGNEIGHIVRMPFEGGQAQDLTPDLPSYSSWGFTSSGSGNHFGFMAADAEGFHIYHLENKANGDVGSPRQLFFGQKITFGPIYSYEGEVAVVSTTDRSTTLHTHLIAIDTASGAQIGELWDGSDSSLEASGFAPKAGDLRLAATTNRSGVRRPVIWNPLSGERVDIPLPELEGDVIPVDWSRDAECLLLCQFAQAVQQLYIYNMSMQALTKLNHPGGTYGLFGSIGIYFGPGDEIFAQWQDAAHPMHLMALDARTGEKTRTVLAAGVVPPGHPWRSISFPSSDGQMIQGWLGVPEGEGPFPVILHTHGGPESVMTEVFAPGSQCWIDHGFAFLTINYRGSTTFGREFQEKIWGNVGYWEMEDLAAAHHWLVREGVGRPDAILLTGASYGGYNTLMGLGKWPELWAGGMAVVAIADWALLYEDSADTLRGYAGALFGGTPQEKPEQYRISSPITYAEQVRAPVLIIQGRNDTRTPSRPVENYEQKLKALGKSIEVEWYDAGHMGISVDRDIQDLEIMLRFAYRVLG